MVCTAGVVLRSSAANDYDACHAIVHARKMRHP